MVFLRSSQQILRVDHLFFIAIWKMLASQIVVHNIWVRASNISFFNSVFSLFCA
jgi:hypothetical protein